MQQVDKPEEVVKILFIIKANNNNKKYFTEKTHKGIRR